MMAEKVHTKAYRTAKSGIRVFGAIHGLRNVEPDPQVELDTAPHLKERLIREHLLEAFSDYSHGTNPTNVIMRRVWLQALLRSLCARANMRKDMSVIDSETFECGYGGFVGERTIIQTRFYGRGVIGNRVWIGPQSYPDARDLVIEDCVGWGAGTRARGSRHNPGFLK